MKKIIFLFSFIALSASIGLAQDKFGHLNFGNLIAQLPEVEDADKELETLQKDMVAKGEEMAKAFQKKYAKFVTDVQGGNLTPLQQQNTQVALQEEQQKIMAYEQEISQKLQQKREELLKPIIQRAETAINDIGKENGYTYIFDTSIYNAVLFAEDSDDLMPIVKKKLGLE